MGLPGSRLLLLAAVRPSTSGDKDVIHVAPAFLAPLDPKLDDGVTRFVEMLGGVPPRRRVTAADVPADKAQAQVHPPTPSLQTHFATFCVGLHIPNLINVLAFCHLDVSSSKFASLAFCVH
jgi:hypothetical protein